MRSMSFFASLMATEYWKQSDKILADISIMVMTLAAPERPSMMRCVAEKVDLVVDLQWLTCEPARLFLCRRECYGPSSTRLRRQAWLNAAASHRSGVCTRLLNYVSPRLA